MKNGLCRIYSLKLPDNRLHQVKLFRLLIRYTTAIFNHKGIYDTCNTRSTIKYLITEYAEINESHSSAKIPNQLKRSFLSTEEKRANLLEFIKTVNLKEM